jgi:hypothetical protein
MSDPTTIERELKPTIVAFLQDKAELAERKKRTSVLNVRQKEHKERIEQYFRANKIEKLLDVENWNFIIKPRPKPKLPALDEGFIESCVSEFAAKRSIGDTTDLKAFVEFMRISRAEKGEKGDILSITQVRASRAKDDSEPKPKKRKREEPIITSSVPASGEPPVAKRPKPIVL